MEENMEMVVNNTSSNELSILGEIDKSNRRTYSSLNLDSVDNKKLLLKVSQNADKRVADILNTPIKLKDVFIQKYDKVDEETGEVLTKTRTILIDSNNNSYATASKGLYNSLLKIFAILGMPDTWEEPLNIKIVETAMKNGGKTYVIEPII